MLTTIRAPTMYISIKTIVDEDGVIYTENELKDKLYKKGETKKTCIFNTKTKNTEIYYESHIENVRPKPEQGKLF